VSWIGTSKREILYQGEVLNISARIMELAKHLTQPVLISRAMAEKIPSGYAKALSYQGNYPVKGVEQPVEVYAVALPAVELPKAIPSLRVAEEKPKVRVAI
jgi:class 3 adenylate cyclase